MKRRDLICHITTVHNAFDTRILYKECASLAREFEEVLLIAPAEMDSEFSRVKIVKIPQFKNRLLRILGGNAIAFLKAKEINAKIYHFHDPEFVIWALFLKLLTRSKVIYDVHEDYYTSILEKKWLKGRLWKRAFASLFSFLEKRVSSFFDAVVLAEEYYADSFAGTNKRIVKILNYPLSTESHEEMNFKKNAFSVVYGGTVSETRGLWNILGTALALARRTSRFKVYIIGKFSSESLLKQAEKFIRENNLHAFIDIVGGDKYVRREVMDLYLKSMDLGLFLPPVSKHYERKLPTKFFEYMLAGIPFVVTDFPEWHKFVQENGCGIAVQPNDFFNIANMIEYYMEHPSERKRMGINGRENALKKYSWRSEEEKLLRLYRELLDL